MIYAYDVSPDRKCREVFSFRKRENSPKLAKISQPSRRTTRKSASRPRRAKVNTKLAKKR